MARRKQPEQPQPDEDDGILESLVELEEQMERLLKSEALLYNGEIGIGGHHETAQQIRKERIAHPEVSDDE